VNDSSTGGRTTPLSRPRQSAASPRCQALTKAGRPCGASVVTGRTGCFQHTATAEERSAAGRRGALATKLVKTKANMAKVAARLDQPSFATAESTRAILEAATASVATGKIAPSQAKAIAGFAKLAIDLATLQLERDILEAEVAQTATPRR
jgi:hypothetical protein